MVYRPRSSATMPVRSDAAEQEDWSLHSETLLTDGPYRATAWEETGLTVSVGVSDNRVFAKLGSDYKKPDATTLISPENFRDILYPLSVRDMLFVGKAAGSTLEQDG